MAVDYRPQSYATIAADNFLRNQGYSKKDVKRLRREAKDKGMNLTQYTNYLKQQGQISSVGLKTDSVVIGQGQVAIKGNANDNVLYSNVKASGVSQQASVDSSQNNNRISREVLLEAGASAKINKGLSSAGVSNAQDYFTGVRNKSIVGNKYVIVRSEVKKNDKNTTADFSGLSNSARNKEVPKKTFIEKEISFSKAWQKAQEERARKSQEFSENLIRTSPFRKSGAPLNFVEKIGAQGLGLPMSIVGAGEQLAVQAFQGGIVVQGAFNPKTRKSTESEFGLALGKVPKALKEGAKESLNPKTPEGLVNLASVPLVVEGGLKFGKVLQGKAEAGVLGRRIREGVESGELSSSRDVVVYAKKEKLPSVEFEVREVQGISGVKVSSVEKGGLAESGVVKAVLGGKEYVKYSELPDYDVIKLKSSFKKEGRYAGDLLPKGGESVIKPNSLIPEDRTRLGLSFDKDIYLKPESFSKIIGELKEEPKSNIGVGTSVDVIRPKQKGRSFGDLFNKEPESTVVSARFQSLTPSNFKEGTLKEVLSFKSSVQGLKLSGETGITPYSNRGRGTSYGFNAEPGRRFYEPKRITASPRPSLLGASIVNEFVLDGTLYKGGYFVRDRNIQRVLLSKSGFSSEGLSGFGKVTTLSDIKKKYDKPVVGSVEGSGDNNGLVSVSVLEKPDQKTKSKSLLSEVKEKVKSKKKSKLESSVFGESVSQSREGKVYVLSSVEPRSAYSGVSPVEFGTIISASPIVGSRLRRKSKSVQKSGLVFSPLVSNVSGVGSVVGQASIVDVGVASRVGSLSGVASVQGQIQSQSQAQSVAQSIDLNFQQSSVFKNFRKSEVEKSKRGSLDLDLPRFNSEKGFFSVEVRRGGVFKTVGRGLRKEQAVRLGEKITGGTAARTYRIKTGERIVGVKAGRGFYLGKGGSVIEKSQSAINTGGELKEISFKGVLTQKRKKLGQVF